MSYKEVTSAELTFAAEGLAEIEDDNCTIILLYLLEVGSPLVVEGALYGLNTESRLADERVRKAILSVTKNSPSPGVRAAAEEILENAGL